MKIDEAIKIIIETKYDVVEGNKEDLADWFAFLRVFEKKDGLR